MSTTASRWLPKSPVAPSGAARPAGPTVAEVLDPAGVTALRVVCHWDRAFQRRWTVVGYTGRFDRINYSNADQGLLFAWLREQHPGVDWSHDHHADLSAGTIHAAPEAWEDGFLPDDDGSFGLLAPPVYVRAGTSWLDTTPPFPFPSIITRRAA